MGYTLFSLASLQSVNIMRSLQTTSFRKIYDRLISRTQYVQYLALEFLAKRLNGCSWFAIDCHLMHSCHTQDVLAEHRSTTAVTEENTSELFISKIDYLRHLKLDARFVPQHDCHPADNLQMSPSYLIHPPKLSPHLFSSPYFVHSRLAFSYFWDAVWLQNHPWIKSTSALTVMTQSRKFGPAIHETNCYNLSAYCICCGWPG